MSVIFVVGILSLALLSSNWLHSKTANFVYSRKLAHFFVGWVVLSYPVLFDTPLIPCLAALAALIILSITHTREVFHGVQKRGRLSEIYFALSALACLASGWFINPWVGVAAGLYMAWGDGITGIIRAFTQHEHAKDWWGSIGCLIVCLTISLLVSPYWIALVGSVVFTVLERYSGDAKHAIVRIDDNVSAPLLSLALMSTLYAIIAM